MGDDVIIDVTTDGSDYQYIYVYRSSDPDRLFFAVGDHSDGSGSCASITREEARLIGQSLLDWVDEG